MWWLCPLVRCELATRLMRRNTLGAPRQCHIAIRTNHSPRTNLTHLRSPTPPLSTNKHRSHVDRGELSLCMLTFVCCEYYALKHVTCPTHPPSITSKTNPSAINPNNSVYISTA